MSYPINYPTPQGADIQIFSSGGFATNTAQNRTWIKPQGASFVWFTLIGAGGQGDTISTGGGSGAVTNFMCPAFLIPDQLRIQLGVGGTAANNSITTFVSYHQKLTTGYTILSAGSGGSGATGGVGGAVMTANYFTAMGFFQSTVGQNGASAAITASTTTFLSGGGPANQTLSANYGYSPTIGSPSNANGFFQTQPIIVGAGGIGIGKGGIGCGGGASGVGGNGMVVIITW